MSRRVPPISWWLQSRPSRWYPDASATWIELVFHGSMYSSTRYRAGMVQANVVSAFNALVAMPRLGAQGRPSSLPSRGLPTGSEATVRSRRRRCRTRHRRWRRTVRIQNATPEVMVEFQPERSALLPRLGAKRYPQRPQARQEPFHPDPDSGLVPVIGEGRLVLPAAQELSRLGRRRRGPSAPMTCWRCAIDSRQQSIVPGTTSLPPSVPIHP